MDRREFLKFGFDFALLALVGRVFAVVPSLAAEGARSGTGRFFELLGRIRNEKLSFQIFYLDLIKFAEGYAVFRQRSERYFTAEAFVEITGIAEPFTNHKSQRATSSMELSLDPAPRLVPRTFDRFIVLRDRKIKTRNLFDYKRNRWVSKIYRDGKLKRRRRRKIPEGVIYENFLSAFYNLRLEAFGPIAKGRTIEFRTIPYRGVDRMSLKVVGSDAARDEARWLKSIAGAEFLIVMQIAEKIMGIKPAKLLAAADRELVPLAGVLKDALPLGNIYVNLKAREYIPDGRRYRIKNIRRSPAAGSTDRD